MQDSKFTTTLRCVAKRNVHASLVSHFADALAQAWWTNIASKPHQGFAGNPQEGTGLLKLWV
jgi:hypothetical protein